MFKFDTPLKYHTGSIQEYPERKVKMAFNILCYSVFGLLVVD